MMCYHAKYYDPKQPGEGKSLFGVTGGSPSWREGKAGTQDRNMEAGTEVESTGEQYLLACSLAHVQLFFLFIIAHVNRDGTTHSGLVLTISIHNQ